VVVVVKIDLTRLNRCDSAIRGVTVFLGRMCLASKDGRARARAGTGLSERIDLRGNDSEHRLPERLGAGGGLYGLAGKELVDAVRGEADVTAGCAELDGAASASRVDSDCHLCLVCHATSIGPPTGGRATRHAVRVVAGPARPPTVLVVSAPSPSSTLA